MSEARIMEWDTFLANIELLVEYEGSPERVAARAGIPYFTLHNWRKRDMRPRIEALRKLASAYGVTLDEIVDRRLTRAQLDRASAHAE